jgi:Ca2+-binding RTX toxin-like protein
VQNGTLQIVGNGASDTLLLQPDLSNPNVLLVDVGADGTTDFSFDASTFNAINVQAGGGDDTVQASNGMAAFGQLTIDGGPGDDTIRGSDGSDVLIGGSGNDSVDGGRGSDTVLLGSGNDSFTWNPGDGSDTVEGQAGKDVLDFNGSNAGEKIDVSANGSRVRLFRDVAAITMDLNGIEGLNLRTLGGTDAVTVNNLAGTDLSAANVDLSSSQGGGDNQADNVVVNGTDGPDNATIGGVGGNVDVSGLGADVRVSGSDAQDSVDVDTLGGDDTTTSGVLTPGPAAIDIDGGAGSDTATYNGTRFADTIGIGPNGGAVATFTPNASSAVQNTTAVENLIVKGRRGDDTIAGQNGIASLTHLTIDGGAGNDAIAGGDGDDTLIGGSGNDSIDGNRGSDVALLGTGNDTFTWDPGDGSDTVEGQAGKDTLDFHGSNAGEKIDLSANGSRVRLFRDVAAITMDLNGIEGLNLNTLGGTDNVTVNDLSGTALRNANIDLSSSLGGGDGSPDTVIANGTNDVDRVNVSRAGSQVLVTGLHTSLGITGSEPASDTLAVNTLAGKDTVAVAPDVSQLIAPVVDLGADQ